MSDVPPADLAREERERVTILAMLRLAQQHFEELISIGGAAGPDVMTRAELDAFVAEITKDLSEGPAASPR